VVSHISRKTSEIWGTPRFVEGRKIGWDTLATVPFQCSKRIPEEGRARGTLE
jgi:hypothetical protein